MSHLWVIFESILIFNLNKSDQNGAEIAYSRSRDFTFGWECKNEFWNHFDFFLFLIQIHLSSGQTVLTLYRIELK